MIWAILLAAAAILAILERLWESAAMRALRFRGSSDLLLAEQGQTVTWSGSVENHSRLPIPFVRLRESFPIQAKVQGDPGWIAGHCRVGIQEWHVEEKLSLKPWQSCTRRVSFAFFSRGEYRLGGYQLSAGDLLGIRERKTEQAGAERVVVIPRRCRNRRALQALGGFLGDISVRRFILEDPILTVGFRDYTAQEPLKAISWTQSARAGSLQVKQYDHTAEQTVVLLLNVENGSPEELEACFRLTRTVCEELEKRRMSFGLRTNGSLPGPVSKLSWMPEGLGSQHLNTILYALGRADYTCYFSFRSLAEQALLHRKNQEAYILITPNSEKLDQGGLRALEAAVGNAVCILSGSTEVEQP